MSKIINLRSYMSLETTETLNTKPEGHEKNLKLLATVDELQQKGWQLTKWVDGHDILLYKYEGDVKAISNVCRHFGGPVGYHKARGGKFTCLWHNWEYSCKDSTCLTHPGLPLRQYELKIQNNEIYINLEG